MRDSQCDEDVSKIDLRKSQTQLAKETKKLVSKEKNEEYQKKYRNNKNSKLQQIISASSEAAEILKNRGVIGRPRIEVDQTDLLKTIGDIAIFGSAVNDRRRTDEIRSCRTLDDMKKILWEMGHQISRSALYLRLLPKNALTSEGKRHVVTVPVKLRRAQNDLHKTHLDEKFCTTSIRFLESIASLLGSKQTCFISQDDKARVPLGLSAANKQSSILMHLEYRVRLPDHDWVIASKHKLIPSVYAGIVLDSESYGNPEAVSYSGPTYIAIRNGKCDTSTAESHCLDIQRLSELPTFRDICKIGDSMKPVWIITVDGDPDENPR